MSLEEDLVLGLFQNCRVEFNPNEQKPFVSIEFNATFELNSLWYISPLTFHGIWVFSKVL